MKNKLVRALVAAAMATAAALGLAACGGASADPATIESEAFIADMQEGVDIVNGQIAQQANMTQIMLASDVQQPTQKYGMWVMPYYPSDAVKKFTMTIQIENGTNFFVTCVSAETGKTWQMDQSGKMTEVIT